MKQFLLFNLDTGAPEAKIEAESLKAAQSRAVDYLQKAYPLRTTGFFDDYEFKPNEWLFWQDDEFTIFALDDIINI